MLVVVSQHTNPRLNSVAVFPCRSPAAFVPHAAVFPSAPPPLPLPTTCVACPLGLRPCLPGCITICNVDSLKMCEIFRCVVKAPAKEGRGSCAVALVRALLYSAQHDTYV